MPVANEVVDEASIEATITTEPPALPEDILVDADGPNGGPVAIPEIGEEVNASENVPEKGKWRMRRLALKRPFRALRVSSCKRMHVRPLTHPGRSRESSEVSHQPLENRMCTIGEQAASDASNLHIDAYEDASLGRV